MAVSHRGAISFGMVHIPVGLYTATQDNDIHFNQLCKEDGSRVKYKKVCGSCGKEIKSGDIIKGFEYDKDKFVIMSDDDFEKAKSEKDKTIHILHFTDLNAIRPIYFEKTYHAVPETGGDKAFELLRKAMKDQGKVAIAKTVMGTKEKLLTLIPTDDGILIETMFFADEVKQAPKEPSHPEVSEAELIPSSCACGCEDEINAAIEKYSEPEEKHRGLMIYYNEDSPVNEKVISAFPSVEVRNGELVGVLTCQITELLTDAEMAEFKSQWTGQCSDGWGEMFEQKEIRTDALGTIYVSFWNSSDSWHIEAEMTDTTDTADIEEEESLDMGGISM